MNRGRSIKTLLAAILFVAGIAVVISVIQPRITRAEKVPQKATPPKTKPSANPQPAVPSPLAGSDKLPLPTMLADFFHPGTQPGGLMDTLFPSLGCAVCHNFPDDGNELETVAPYDSWVTSMMAQAARDPVWKAAVAIANQDAQGAGEFCIRCHAPLAWLAGNSAPGDPNGLSGTDLDGVSCHFCHRLVDPVFKPGNPDGDEDILLDLIAQDLLPEHPGNAQYVVDPFDSRRGPYDDVPANFHGVPMPFSQFHLDSALCGTCHDVSNPVYTRQPDGSYTVNMFDMPHPTHDPGDMFPEQRTYSEWLASDFARGGVLFEDHRFGGNHPTGLMQSCQDCHVPDQLGGGCVFWDSLPFFIRPDLPQHSFSGANSWVLGAIHSQFPEFETGLNANNVAEALARNREMLANASDLLLFQTGDVLNVRIINQTGHKLPTGYPEGRRMWINVRYFDEFGSLISEHGAYDETTATLITEDTTVFEMLAGLDAYAANATGLPVGESFHLVLYNVVLKDNRIPPRGFTNSAFEAFYAPPVGETYQDGQYWHDSMFDIPAKAVESVVTVYYQTTSREYIEFLAMQNTTNIDGDVALQLWNQFGKSMPVVMDSTVFSVTHGPLGDANGDGVVTYLDLLAVIFQWGLCPAAPELCPADLNEDGRVGIDDLLQVLADWGR